MVYGCRKKTGRLVSESPALTARSIFRGIYQREELSSLLGSGCRRRTGGLYLAGRALTLQKQICPWVVANLGAKSAAVTVNFDLRNPVSLVYPLYCKKNGGIC